MFKIEHATINDIDVIKKFDEFIPSKEMKKKLETNPEQYLLLKEDDIVIGVLRYNLFWDYIPYAYYLHVSDSCRGKGYAKEAILFWEEEMREQGWPMLMTSIPTFDPAQHFYRKMGYKDAGCLTLNEGLLKDAPELFFTKVLVTDENAQVGPHYKK